MKPLTIQTYYPCDVTVIPNRFFDEYMPHANGEFVKIYFYILRMTASNMTPSLVEIADRLNYTEQDVMRALRYWEKEGIICLGYDTSGDLVSLTLKNFCGGVENSSLASANVSVDNCAKVLPSRPELPSDYSDRKVSPQRMNELSDNEDIREMFFIVQQYMGKMLSPGESQKFLYLYDELHFSTDLITFLVEYCIEKNHKSMRYIEKVALNWYDEGIKTVSDARRTISSYRKEYYDIFKALGISGHNPIEAEVTIMKKWIDKFGFSMDVITQACTRTIMNTKKPSLQYADSILSSWFKEGVATLEDIEKLDRTYESSKTAERSKNQTAAKSNRFNEFEQRNTDYASLEQQLLDLS